jgi:hypothetical protein
LKALLLCRKRVTVQETVLLCRPGYIGKAKQNVFGDPMYPAQKRFVSGIALWQGCAGGLLLRSAQTLPSSDSSLFSGDRFQWSDKPIPEASMVPLSVIMCNELPNRVAQGIFTEEDHLLQTVLLDRADKTFRICVQIWRSRWQFDGLNSTSGETAQKRRRVQRISIMNQKAFSGEEAINRIR